MGYLLNLGYTAVDYASFNRAEVVVTLQNGYQFTTAVLDAPDYDRNALVLRNIPTKFTSPQELPGSVHFDISHSHYRHQHMAIENADETTLAKIFPPDLKTIERKNTTKELTALKSGPFRLDWQYQLKALNQMLSCEPAAPYLLLGPFGTGKTYLLAAVVTKLIDGRRNRVLVCTHRRRGADGIYKTLQDKRIRNVARMVGSADDAEKMRMFGSSAITPLDTATGAYSVLVTTFGVAGNLVESVRQGLVRFSHILIDEGAQCPEPEALGALILAQESTKVIIVGDNKQVLLILLPIFAAFSYYIRSGAELTTSHNLQVGPKVRVLSDTARENGLGESILERLYSHYKAKRHLSLVKTHTSTLLTNYRCHPSILMLASSLFYECTLLSKTKRQTHPKAPYPLVFACTSVSQNGYRDCRPENEEEAKLLIDKLVEFIRTWPKPNKEQRPNPPKEQIGVLASTKQQVR